MSVCDDDHHDCTSGQKNVFFATRFLVGVLLYLRTCSFSWRAVCVPSHLFVQWCLEEKVDVAHRLTSRLEPGNIGSMLDTLADENFYHHLLRRLPGLFYSRPVSSLLLPIVFPYPQETPRNPPLAEGQNVPPRPP